MMEKLGKAKTHLEIQKMIKEVDTTGSGTINYREFVLMMLGGKSTILKLYVSALKSITSHTYISDWEAERQKNHPKPVFVSSNLPTQKCTCQS